MFCGILPSGFSPIASFQHCISHQFSSVFLLPAFQCLVPDPCLCFVHIPAKVSLNCYFCRLPSTVGPCFCFCFIVLLVFFPLVKADFCSSSSHPLHVFCVGSMNAFIVNQHDSFNDQTGPNFTTCCDPLKCKALWCTWFEICQLVFFLTSQKNSLVV